MTKSITLSFKKACLVLVAVVMAAAGVGAATYGFYYRGRTNQNSPDFANLSQIYQILKTKYDGNIDASKLVEGAKAGVAAATGDPYTEYLTADQAKSLSDDLNGSLSGIGAEIGIKNNVLVVIAPLDGSPAAKAGLKAGDQIAKIDSTNSSTLTLEQAVSKIRGPKDTQVKLTIVRPSSQPQVITITRAEIKVPSVKSSMKPGNIGYIQIGEFGSDTAALVDQAASALASQGAKKIVLDLRDDPGGYLDAAVKVASEFLPANKLVVEQRRGGKSISKLDSEPGGRLISLSVVVLINGGSASASEILAGALHDNGVAKLVGEKSFGKGSVQEIVSLSGGAELKVTVAHWYTPAGKNIGSVGISPDVVVANSQSDLDQGKDPQLSKALQLLAP